MAIYEIALYLALTLSIIFTLVMLKKRTNITVPLAIALWIITGIVYMTGYVDFGMLLR